MENEEKKLEENKTENAEENKTATEEKKVNNRTNNKALLPDIVDIEKLTPEDKPLKEEIEEKRQELYKVYTKSRRTSNILMGVVVLVVIGSMALLMVNKDWSKIVGYSLAGAALVGLIIFSVLTKNKFPRQSKEYIRFVTTRIDRDIYNNTEFQDVKVDLNQKYSITELNLERVYKNSVDIGSRNIVKGLYLGQGFSCGELALYSVKEEGKKRMKAVSFIGKHVELQNTLHFEGRYIINFRAEKQNDLPTDIDDLVELRNEDNLVIYGPEGSDFSKDIPAKYLSELKKIKVEGHLFNLNVVLWAGHTGVYLSYDDPVVSVPFDKPFDDEPQFIFKNHLLAVLGAERIINK